MPYHSRRNRTLPDYKTPIWRYIDIPQLISILDKEALWFSRVDVLEDAFEGSIPKANVQCRPMSAEESEAPIEFYESLPRVNENQRKRIFVNCWHMNKKESVAMWDQYGHQGVAVQSTVGSFVDCFEPTNQGIVIGEVEYVDYNKEKIDESDVFDPCFHKRESYQYEQELRAALLDWKLLSDCGLFGDVSDEKRGIPFDIDICSLIERVYLSPEAPTHVADAVDYIVRHSSLNVEIRKSSLDEDPVY